MAQKKWLVLLVAEFGGILCLTPYINKYDILGWLSFLAIFLVIPFTIYKSLPNHRFSAPLAMSTPIILGLSWGYWLGLYEIRKLDKEGVRTKGMVTVIWNARTKNGGTEKLFRIRFKTNGSYQGAFSHKNTANYQVGDSVLVDYLPLEPNTYRIIK
jgi:hypothetical protein